MRKPFKKRLHVPTSLIKNTKPYVYEYSHGFGMYSNQTKSSAFFLQYDVKNLCDNTFLGDGLSPTKSPSLFIDSPDLIDKMDAASVFANMMTGAVGMTNTRQVFWLSPREYTWNIVNSEGHPIRLSMYWCKARHDVALLASPVYTGFDQTYFGNDLNDILGRCLVTDGIVASYSANVNVNLMPSFSPFESASFCGLFKVIRKKDYELNAGQCLDLVHTTKDWWKLADYYERSLQKTIAWRKRTIMPLFVIRGCPVTDSAAYNKVDIGKSRISVRYSAKTNVYMENITKQQYHEDYLSAPGGSVSLATSVYMSHPVAANVVEN